MCERAVIRFYLLSLVWTAVVSVRSESAPPSVGIGDVLTGYMIFTMLVVGLNTNLNTADRVDHRLRSRFIGTAAIASACSVAVNRTGLDQFSDLLQIQRLDTQQSFCNQMNFFALLGQKLLGSLYSP